MTIRNRNMHSDARVRFSAPAHIDISSDTEQATVVAFDNDRDIKVRGVFFIYTVATDTGSHVNVDVGTAADDDLYVGQDTTDSQSVGAVEEATLLSTALVAAGTPLLVTRTSGAATNTGEIDVIVEYELVDRTSV